MLFDFPLKERFVSKVHNFFSTAEPHNYRSSRDKEPCPVARQDCEEAPTERGATSSLCYTLILTETLRYQRLKRTLRPHDYHAYKAYKQRQARAREALIHGLLRRASSCSLDRRRHVSRLPERLELLAARLLKVTYPRSQDQLLLFCLRLCFSCVECEEPPASASTPRCSLHASLLRVPASRECTLVLY